MTRLLGLPQKGFNLIEAAIVLGVVGAVIGGIWWGASKIREDWQVQEVGNNIKIMVTRLNKFYQNLHPTTQVQLDPNTLLFDSSYLLIPWAKYVNTVGEDYMRVIITPDTFAFLVFFTKKSICIQLVKNIVNSDTIAKDISLGMHLKNGNAINLGYASGTYLSSAQQAYSVANTYCPEKGMVTFAFRY